MGNAAFEKMAGRRPVSFFFWPFLKKCERQVGFRARPDGRRTPKPRRFPRRSQEQEPCEPPTRHQRQPQLPNRDIFVSAVKDGVIHYPVPTATAQPEKVARQNPRFPRDLWPSRKASFPNQSLLTRCLMKIYLRDGGFKVPTC